MTEHPILFSGAMVRAILEGRKTVTRRVPPDRYLKWKKGDILWVRETLAIESNYGVESSNIYPPPFNDGRPVRWDEDYEGDKYWEQCHYRATDPTPELLYENSEGEPMCRWRPSIHMPRWASRITLELTEDVYKEPLQAIPWQDFRKEGVNCPTHDFHGGFCVGYCYNLTKAFKSTWDSINAPRGFPWASNPNVAVIKFEVV